MSRRHNLVCAPKVYFAQEIKPQKISYNNNTKETERPEDNENNFTNVPSEACPSFRYSKFSTVLQKQKSESALSVEGADPLGDRIFLLMCFPPNQRQVSKYHFAPSDKTPVPNRVTSLCVS